MLTMLSLRPGVRCCHSGFGWGSIFNCGRMVILGGVVLVISKRVRFTGGGSPPSPFPTKEPEKPRPPPPRTGLLHVILRYLIVPNSIPLLPFFGFSASAVFCSTIRRAGDVGKERASDGGNCSEAISKTEEAPASTVRGFFFKRASSTKP